MTKCGVLVLLVRKAITAWVRAAPIFKHHLLLSCSGLQMLGGTLKIRTVNSHFLLSALITFGLFSVEKIFNPI